MSLSNALNLWVEVTGVDPSKGFRTMGEWNVMHMHQLLKEALDLDETEITGKIMFKYLATKYFRERNFSVEELLEKPDQVSQYLGKSRDLMKYLRSAELSSIGEDFMSKMKSAAESYGARSKEVADMVSEPHMLAILRRDAMRTLKNLQINQFLSGSAEPEDTRPAYGKFVYRWWNINSMLKAMTAMPSGVTVNLICNPANPYRSYFVFAIRNGGNLFVFTDKEKTPHPMAEDLMRRPDKIMAERAGRNWFPYDLAGLAFDDEGRPYIARSEATELVPYQSETEPIKALSDLEAPVTLWLIMMLDLIVGKFWREGYRAPALSYTGEMVKIDSPLITAANAANLPVVGYQPLSLAPLTVADVKSESVSEDHVGKRGKGQNQWMEDRYAHQVPEETVNTVQSSESKLALEFKDGKQSVVAVDDKAESKLSFWQLEEIKKNRIEIASLDATSFGTREEIEADRRFIARSNYAKQIERLAEVEFKDRKKDVIAWVRTRVEENLSQLYPLMTRNAILVPCEKLDSVHSSGAFTWRGETKDGYMRRFVDRTELTGENRRQMVFSEDAGHISFAGDDYKQGCRSCFHTNAPSAYTVQFMPETTQDLAFLCGCEIDELPDVLQHWTMIKAYIGNGILNRIDPMEWQCANPWQTLTFALTFFFSIRAMKAIDKQYGHIPTQFEKKAIVREPQPLIT